MRHSNFSRFRIDSREAITAEVRHAFFFISRILTLRWAYPHSRYRIETILTTIGLYKKSYKREAFTLCVLLRALRFKFPLLISNNLIRPPSRNSLTFTVYGGKMWRICLPLMSYGHLFLQTAGSKIYCCTQCTI